MNSRKVMRAVVCAALVAVCAAGAGWFPAHRVAGQEAKTVALHGAAAFDHLKQAGQSKSLPAPATPSRFRAGVRNAPGKEQLNAGQLNEVLHSLREKTGWQALDFDQAGFLVCPDPNVFSGGSAAARRLLGEAISGAEAYDLEVHNRSLAVSFARLETGTDLNSHSTGAKISAYPIQIDFADFYQLGGDEPALKAFDIGFAILHELAHGVWRMRDATPGEEELGECETFINRIRRELHLPERQNYFARARLGRLKRTQLIAELRFAGAVEKQGETKQAKQAKQAKQTKEKSFLLQWEAEAVGPITGFNRAAKAGLTAAIQ